MLNEIIVKKFKSKNKRTELKVEFYKNTQGCMDCSLYKKSVDGKIKIPEICWACSELDSTLGICSTPKRSYKSSS